MVTVSRRVTIAVALLAIASASAFAAKISDVKNTKHNLSATPYSAGTDTRTVKATSESQICVFCHTPHKANAAAQAPLWNRALSASDGTYTKYTSESMDATLDQPEGSSKLCLSCHDGTMALGNVGVLNGQVDQTIAMAGTAADWTMPDTTNTTGYTRDLGTDLTNDHPISFTYDSTLASADGELVDPSTTPGNNYIKNRTLGATHPDIPLENGKVQCVSCHDPHIRDVDMAKNAKFLRLNRFQENAPNGGTFSANDDTVCLACHDKDKAGWSGSAHANPLVAGELYDSNSNAVLNGDFDTDLPVWKAACLNCHDTHTVQGARRLLRAGVSGSSPALEQTCYQCHSNDGATLTTQGLNTQVPDIKSDFASTYAMPIANTTEVHAIGTGTDATEGTQRGKDFVESPALLGKGNLTNRHAECTDCHNPHRVIKNRLFNANPATPEAAGTHTHTLAAGQTHSNLASGVLAGTTGVEPVYASTAWDALPSSYTLKKGSGGVAANTAVSNSYVTREYQVCLKCHSDYAWNEPNRPVTGPSIGTNGVTMYTNQAMEFQAPATDKGEKAVGTSGAAANHRSWHPVIDNTGRTAAVRANMNPNTFLAPWNDATATNVGNQTMYCSDCHGSDVTSLTSVVPNGGEDGNSWGPHGSSNNFILKGTWDDASGAAGAADTGICFRCHDWNQYANNNNASPLVSGFRQPTATQQCAVNFDTVNMHVGHAQKIGKPLQCTWCHVAVPHGWKNKAFLIDISLAAPNGCGGAVNCNAPPYIMGGYLGGSGATPNWKPSGQWVSGDCGGRAWMNNTCANPL